MTMLTRMGFGHNFTALLPNGDHLTVWHDQSCERVRFEKWKCECKRCKGNPDGPHCFTVTNLVRRIEGRGNFRTTRAALEDIAPGVDFGVRPDDTFPVRAYMKYTDWHKRTYPHIANDIPEDVQ